ncbi:uncharacterized protein LOC129586781 [Paramacrobiotus metropolitanus]|uniref:uncharacterized protein LOC129586781 n=1 Tax=Paramacrobiotus metropolitanus TaxID=2943436 RepID=UPI0024456C45|nr:uncharacterized protein LOC129586781 [Paramacrobiotus metropolitanus]XP_055336171.1 uncharacterized protein LOC129586781 [Paramacrobiotus metropolitanus]XP_055336172.1 uncharacterized protein LOC129586781 [Paramacrobiotus metropolitanus]XP_055336173.1 uncharacterized protein LOC129586781 [Paramacrobiotus metropolitanus]XP_055336175.1 uncharacterized protein LOC129586781 [Paramacrobiotus metropolitanus]
MNGNIDTTSNPDEKNRIPVLDYDNYEYAHTENETFLASIKEILADKPPVPFRHEDPFGKSIESPEVNGKTSKEALKFLKNIDPKWISEIAGDEEIDIYLHENIIGKYTVKTHRLAVLDYLPIIHVKVILEIHSGSIAKTVYHEGCVNGTLETIWQKSVEEEKVGAQRNRYTCYIEKREKEFLVNVLNLENGSSAAWYHEYTKDLLEGFVGMCANVLLERLLAANEVTPENLVFLTVDRLGCIQKMEYSQVPNKMIALWPYRTDCFGFQTTTHLKDRTVSCSTYLLNRRVVYKEIPDNEAVIKRNTVPPFEKSASIPPLKKQIRASEEMGDNWFINLQKDEQLRFARMTYSNTVGRYPKLVEPLQQMVHAVLVFRPDDIFGFVNKTFQKWRTVFKEQQRTSEQRNTKDTTDTEIPATENDFINLLKAYQS